MCPVYGFIRRDIRCCYLFEYMFSFLSLVPPLSLPLAFCFHFDFLLLIRFCLLTSLICSRCAFVHLASPAIRQTLALARTIWPNAIYCGHHKYTSVCRKCLSVAHMLDMKKKKTNIQCELTRKTTQRSIQPAKLNRKKYKLCVCVCLEISFL